MSLLKSSNYHSFALLAEKVGLVALDIGARGGVCNDLLPIAKGVDYYGFEPDPEECARLNQHKLDCWKSLAFIPTALGDIDGHFDLNLYRQKGCSSKLRVKQEAGKLFSRGDYYIHDGIIKVPVNKLDNVLNQFNIESPAFMKIDVQGMEIEVLKGSANSLAKYFVGIRSEVYFFQQYEGQPLFAEVDYELRSYGFVLMRFLYTREWRRLTRIKYPNIAEGKLPYSRGQLMHGDVLYLLHPETINPGSEENIKRLIRLGLVSICYQQFDHAYAAFNLPRVKEYLLDVYKINIGLDLISLSVRLAKKAAIKEKWRLNKRKLKQRLLYLLNIFIRLKRNIE